MPLEPSLDAGMLVSAVVIHYQVQGCFTGKLLIQTAEKFQKLLMPMPFLALPDDSALQGF